MKANLLSWQKLLMVPPLLLGTAVLIFFVVFQGGAEQAPAVERKRVLQVIEVPQVDLVPRVLVYGTAQPGRTWRAVARLKGHVQWVNAKLKSGAMIKKDEVLLKIDETEYKLVTAQIAAEIKQVDAQLAEMKASEDNYRASQTIEQRSLELARAEWLRVKSLSQRKSASRSDLNKTERDYLVQKQNVQTIENALSLLPAQRDALKASQEVKKNKLAQAELDLKRTILKAPFNCRLAEVSIEKGQYLSAGERLFEAYSTDFAELEAQFSMEKGRVLIDPKFRKALTGLPDFNLLRELFKIEATIRLRQGSFVAEWKGTFDRFREQLDPKTRTIGVIFRVDRPYENLIPGKRPPILKGAFCEVEVRAKSRKALIIPVSAFHNGAVYFVNDKNRLERRKIDIHFAQGNFLVVKKGLRKAERIIVSPPMPAIDGMLVEPVTDDQLIETLVEAASGKGELR